MDTVPIPEEIENEIDIALNDLNSPLRLGKSQLLSLLLVAKRREENPTELPYQTLRAVLADVLDALKLENPDYADILHGRFWEGLSPTNMIANGRPKQWAEKTFFNYQKKARREFHSIFWQREQSLRQGAQLSVDLQPTTVEQTQTRGGNKPKFSKQSMFSSFWVYLLLVLFAFSVVALYAIISKKGIEAPGPTLAPTLIPITPTPTLSGTTPTLIYLPAFCGETKQTQVDLSIPRFVRSQGVSNFNVENTPGLLNNDVRALAIDKTGLWIGYFGSDKNTANGVGHYDKKNFADCDFSAISVSHNINALAIGKSGEIWVGTEKNGILLFDGKEWHLYTTRDGLPSNEIFALTVDSQGNLWVGTWEGVAKFDGTIWSVPYQVQNDTIFNNHVSSIAFDSEHNTWIGHIRDGVSKYQQSEGKWIYYTLSTENGLAGDEIRSIVVRPQSAEQPESVWFATADGGVSRFEQGKWTIYRVEDGLPSNDVSDLALDRYNRVWVATAKGVAYFDDRIWKIYNSFPTLTIAIGTPCQKDTTCPFDDDHVWTGTPTLGLTHSRLPLPDEVIKVTSICFVTSQRERICPEPSFDTSLPTMTVTAIYPAPVKPSDTLRFEITVSPEETYELRENRGDFMSNTDDDDFNLFGAWPVIGVKGTIAPGQPYTFTDYDNPFVAPKLPDGIQEKQFISTWRMWIFTRYVGPYIRLIFTVKNN